MRPGRGGAPTPSRPVVVSACLIGVACRYDGRDNRSADVVRVLGARTVWPMCPEVAAGLGAPRVPFALDHPDVGAIVATLRGLTDRAGVDVAPRLVPVATALARAAAGDGVAVAVLKERSPSCGTSQVYVGDRVCHGAGVFAWALRQAGVVVLSDEDVFDEGLPVEALVADADGS